MSRWVSPSPGWDAMIKGSPASSYYLWMAALFSFIAISGLIRAGRVLHGNQISIWAPTLVGFVLLMVVAAIGAIRAVRKARSNPDEELSRQAFRKYRTYGMCALLVAFACWLLVAFLP